MHEELEKLKCIILEQLSYSGSLHIKHIRICETYKQRVIGLLVISGEVVITRQGIIYPANLYYR